MRLTTSEIEYDLSDENDISKSLITVKVVLPEAFSDDGQFDPNRALVNILFRSCYTPHNAVLFGQWFLQTSEPDPDEFAFVEGVNYRKSSLDVGQNGLGISAGDTSWFFTTCPMNVPVDKLHQALATKAICILCNYRGPADLNELLAGLNPETPETAIATRLLEFCDSILLSEKDGYNFKAISKEDLMWDTFN